MSALVDSEGRQSLLPRGRCTRGASSPAQQLCSLFLVVVFTSAGCSSASGYGPITGDIALPPDFNAKESAARITFSDATPHVPSVFAIEPLDATTIRSRPLGQIESTGDPTYYMSFIEDAGNERAVGLLFKTVPRAAANFIPMLFRNGAGPEDGEVRLSIGRPRVLDGDTFRATGAGSVRVEPQPDGTLFVDIKSVVLTAYPDDRITVSGRRR